MNNIIMYDSYQIDEKSFMKYTRYNWYTFGQPNIFISYLSLWYLILYGWTYMPQLSVYILMENPLYRNVNISQVKLHTLAVDDATVRFFH